MSAAPSVSAASASAPTIVSVSLATQGVAVITLDDPSSPVNTITEEFGFQLGAALDRVESDPAIVAAVMVSGKSDFVVGANIEMLKAIKFSSDAERMARELSVRLGRIRRSGKPVVAAVHGQALGGGFELALACHAIVLSNDKKTQVALPEVKLGLIPGANGLLRVAERAGLQVAIDLGLTGRNVRAAKAKALGLAEEVCPLPLLRAVAIQRALALASSTGNSDAARANRAKAKKAEHPFHLSLDAKTIAHIALEDNPLGRRLLFKKAREAARKKSHGHYPATTRVLDVLEMFGRKGFTAAAELEAKCFGELVVSETSHRLIEMFFATTGLKKDSGVDDPNVAPRTVDRVGVLGGGLMGAGVAYVTINAGIPVRLKDKDDVGIGRGLKYVRGILDERVKKKQLTGVERDQLFARLTGATDFSGLRNAELVVEAVFEDLALKQAVLREVEAVTRPDCIFASNTSSIPIGKIAAASAHPETVLGMHYFSPVHKMPLLEVVRTEKTAPWALATAVALGKKQGKTVIVVNDGVGFYTSRILAPYLNEASHMLAEGVPVEAIDHAMIDWGFPVGPLKLLDEVGIDVGAHVGEIVHAAFGDRLTPPSATSRLLADNRKGRKNGRGFYVYGAAAGGRSGKEVDSSIYKALGIEPRGKLPIEEIQMRCALQLVNEALLCFGEGVLRSARDGDVGAVLGLGFPPFRGGPFRYVDTIGAAEILRRTQSYADRFGRRFTPAPVLVDMAKKGERFYPR